MILAPVAFLMLLAGGVPLRILGLMILTGMVAAGVLLGAMFLPQRLGASPATQAKVMRAIGVSEYQRNRLRVYLAADTDPLGAGWNKMQSEIAIGSGGVWGKGYLKGTQNILGYLPRTVAPTDFIYSVIAEETGFAGSLLVLVLFGAVFLCGLMGAMISRDKMGRLLCVGVVALLFSHVAINIAMTVGILPITGLPLPLLSYGGSFMVVTMSALGIVQSVYIRARHALAE
jgi:rod shape determining protein RodA